MRKLAVLFLAAALLLVSACGMATDGGSKPPPYGDASPTPSATAAPIVYEPVELPDYYPPLDFQVDSVWQSAPFGDRGAAVLYMGTAEGKEMFKLYTYNYTDVILFEPDGPSITYPITLSFTAQVDGEGADRSFSALQSESGYIGIRALSALCGSLTVSGIELTIRYLSASES